MGARRRECDDVATHQAWRAAMGAKKRKHDSAAERWTGKAEKNKRDRQASGGNQGAPRAKRGREPPTVGARQGGMHSGAAHRPSRARAAICHI